VDRAGSRGPSPSAAARVTHAATSRARRLRMYRDEAGAPRLEAGDRTLDVSGCSCSFKAFLVEREDRSPDVAAGALRDRGAHCDEELRPT